MEDPSTIRRAVVGAAIGGAPYGGDSLAGQTVATTDQLFCLVINWI
jgi:hypothetical protein